jgi:hypothetical protein
MKAGFIMICLIKDFNLSQRMITGIKTQAVNKDQTTKVISRD